MSPRKPTAAAAETRHSDQLKGDKRYEHAQHLDPLTKRRFWRTRSEPDLSLATLSDQFEREHVRPHKRLAVVYPLWIAVIGEQLTQQTRLDSLTRGVLRVTVANPAALYAIDRILRDGGERQLITAYRRGTLRKINLKLGPITGPDFEPADERR